MDKRENGAVTIFCIIVLFSIILLGGVFIDGSRVLLARQIMRSAMNSAARSSLSYYNTGMVGDFGLYGVSEEDAKTQFERYLRNNLSLSQNDGFNLYYFDLGENPVTVTVSEPLDNEDVFIDQVSEYAKYRAGINLTIGVVEKVKMLFGGDNAGNKVFGAVDQSKAAVDQLKKEAKSFSTRVNAKLKSAVDTNAKKAKETLRNCIQNSQPLDFGETTLMESITEANSAVDDLNQSKDSYNAAAKQANEEMDGAQAAIGSGAIWNESTKTWETVAANKVADEKITPSNTPDQQAQSLIDAAQTEVDATQHRIAQNINAAKAKAAEAQNLQTEIKQLEEDLDALTQPNSSLAQKRDETKKALEDFQDEHKLQVDLSLKEKKEQLQTLKNNPPAEDPSQYQKQLQVLTEEIKLIEADDEAKSNYTSSLTQYLEKQTKLSAEKKKLNKLLDEIDGLYDAMPSTATLPSEINCDTEISAEHKEKSSAGFAVFWDKLNSFYDKTIGEFSKVDSSIDGSDPTDLTQAENPDGSWGAIDKLVQLAKGISAICQNPNRLLESAYLVDYAIDKFTFLTSQSSRPAHHFQLGEVEYILKGNPVQGANIGSVLGDIILLRVVINFVDDLIHTHSPEPISRVLVALGRALMDTASDMYDMLFRDGCSLCPSFKNIKLTYSDHLRLQLLMDTVGLTSRTDMKDRMVTMMNRTMDVKDVKDAKYAGALYTRVEATAEARIDLIMMTLPMFGGLMPGQDVIKDGTFLIRETVSMGY